MLQKFMAALRTLEIRRLGQEALGPRDLFNGDKRGAMVSVTDWGPESLKLVEMFRLRSWGKMSKLAVERDPAVRTNS